MSAQRSKLRTCQTCKIPKSLDEFYTHASAAQPTAYTCYECLQKKEGKARRERIAKLTPAQRQHLLDLAWAGDLRRKFGLTPADYAALELSQKYGCAICGVRAKERTTRSGGKCARLHVDHCHSTGVVRGLLCYGCNSALGLFKDNVAALKAAAAYLERTKETAK